MLGHAAITTFPRKVLLIASRPGLPRVWRIGFCLAKMGLDVTVLEWGERGRLPVDECIRGIRVFRMRLKAPYGLRLFFKLPLWWTYISVFVLLNRFTVVQPQNLDSLLATWIACRLKRTKIVYDLADFYSDAYIMGLPFASRFARRLERTLIKSVHGLILVSERQLDQVQRRNLPKYFRFIYNTLPGNELSLGLNCGTHATRARSRIILFYGGALGWDRLELLLKLGKALGNTGNIRLVVGGFGEMEESASKVFRKMRNVEYLGFLSHNEVLRQTASCDFVVLPYHPRTYNNSIGLPNKLFEALSLSKPLLAQRGTYMAQIVEENRCGIVTDFLDTNVLSETLRAIEKYSRQQLSKMGIRAKRLYLAKYRWSSMEKSLLGLYRQVLHD